jgi:hypothetical protein
MVKVGGPKMNTTSRRDFILSMTVAGAALDLSRSPVIAAPTRVPRTPVALKQVRHSLTREQRSVLSCHVQQWMKEREAGQYLKQRHSQSEVTVRDVRDNSIVVIDGSKIVELAKSRPSR